MFKPSWVIIPGPDGVMTRKYRRQLYWQCDVDPRGGHILTQTRLSFNRTTSVQVQQGGGTPEGGTTILLFLHLQRGSQTQI